MNIADLRKLIENIDTRYVTNERIINHTANWFQAELLKAISDLPDVDTAAPQGDLVSREGAAQLCEGLVTFAPEHEKYVPADPEVPCGWCDSLELAAERIRALPSAAPPGKCTWTETATCYWTTSCGHDFTDDDGISFKWCGYCGGKLVEQQAKWAPDDNGPDR